MEDANFLGRDSIYAEVNFKWKKHVSAVRINSCNSRDQSFALQLEKKTWYFRVPWSLNEMAFLMDECDAYGENFFDKDMFYKDPRVQAWKNIKKKNELSEDEDEEEFSLSNSDTSLSSSYYDQYVFEDTANLDEELLAPLQASLRFPFVQGICYSMFPCSSFKDCTSFGQAFSSLADILDCLIGQENADVSIANLDTHQTLYGPKFYFAYLQ